MQPLRQPFDQLEKEMLNGQKLQGERPPLKHQGDPVADHMSLASPGVETAKELHIFLKARGKVEEYPLFTFVVRTSPPDLCSNRQIVRLADETCGMRSTARRTRASASTI